MDSYIIKVLSMLGFTLDKHEPSATRVVATLELIESPSNIAGWIRRVSFHNEYRLEGEDINIEINYDSSMPNGTMASRDGGKTWTWTWGGEFKASRIDIDPSSIKFVCR